MNMVVKAEQDRVKHLLSQALPMLCKNGLSFDSEFSIEALIGITLDKNDVFLVSIKETVTNGEAPGDKRTLDVSVTKVANDAIDSLTTSPKSKSHRKRRRSRTSKSRDSESETEVEMIDDHSAIKREKVDDQSFMNTTEDADQSLKSEQDKLNSSETVDEDSSERVTVKTEPQDVGFDSSFGDMSQVSGTSGYDISATTAYSTPSQGAVSQHDMEQHASTSQHDAAFSPALPSIARQDSNDQTPDTLNSTVPTPIGMLRPPEKHSVIQLDFPSEHSEYMLKVDSTWICAVCHKEFTRNHNLRHHINQVHLGGARHQCHICLVSFTRKDNLKVHIRNVHFQKSRYQCRVCEKSFGRRDAMQRHMYAAHNIEMDPSFIGESTVNHSTPTE